MSAAPNSAIPDPQVSGRAGVTESQQPSAMGVEAEPSAQSDEILTAHSAGVTVEYLPDHTYHITLGLVCRSGKVILRSWTADPWI